MALSLRRALLLAVASAVVLVGPDVPASAHGGAAVFEVLEASEVAPRTVSLRLGITFESDGEPAEGAIVDVVAIAPDGSAAPSVRLERAPLGRDADAGVYAGTFAPDDLGVWTFAVTSSFPPGETEVTVAVAGESAPGTRTVTNLVIAAVFGTLGGALGLWASRRRSARKRAAASG